MPTFQSVHTCGFSPNNNLDIMFIAKHITITMKKFFIPCSLQILYSSLNKSQWLPTQILIGVLIYWYLFIFMYFSCCFACLLVYFDAQQITFSPHLAYSHPFISQLPEIYISCGKPRPTFNWPEKALQYSHITKYEF